MKRRILTILFLLIFIDSITGFEGFEHRWDFYTGNNINVVGFYRTDDGYEIVVGAGRNILILDNNGNLIENYTLDIKGIISAIGFGDIDYDNTDEILIGVGWVETKDVNISYLAINKTDIGFKERVVYRTAINLGGVFVLDDKNIKKLFDTDGWVRAIRVDTLYDDWKKYIITGTGGINHIYYREKLPEITYEHVCVPNVKKIVDQAGNEKYWVEVTNLSKDIDTCRHHEACAPEVKSYHGRPRFYEDCCVSSEKAKACCDRNDTSCNGTYAYPSEKQCIYIPEDLGGLVIWDKDYDAYGVIGDWGCYEVLRWDCGYLECHKIDWVFKDDTFYNSSVGIYDTNGKLIDKIDINNLRYGDCSFDFGDYIRNVIVSDFLKFTKGKEIIFNSGPYLLMLDRNLNETFGLFLGCDYRKDEYSSDELMKIDDFAIFDFDNDGEGEIMFLYIPLNELYVIDKKYNWMDGSCSEKTNESTGIETKEFTAPFDGYVSPDWTFRMPMGEKIRDVDVVQIKPYNYSQIMVLSDNGIYAITYGISEPIWKYEIKKIDKVYFVDLDNNNQEDMIVTDGKHLYTYEISSEFIKNNSARMYYECAKEYVETDINKAIEYVRNAIELYKEINDSEGIKNANILLNRINRNRINRILKQAENAYALALSNYNYNNKLAKKYAEKALMLYESINDSNGIFECKKLINKINEKLSETTTTTNHILNNVTSTISGTITVSTTLSVGKGFIVSGDDIIIIIVIIICVFIIFSFIVKRFGDRYSKK